MLSLRPVFLVAVLLLAACGGEDETPARDAFIADWEMAGTVTITIAGERDTAESGVLLKIKAGTGADEVKWILGVCPYTARATSDSSLSIEPVVCPPQANEACQQVTLSVNQGTVTRTGDSLSFVASGSIAAVCDGVSSTGTFTQTLAGSRT